MFDARILGTGSFLPERIVPNTELEENMVIDMVERRDNSKGWVTLKTDK